jgi:hypothetical protein
VNYQIFRMKKILRRQKNFNGTPNMNCLAPPLITDHLAVKSGLYIYNKINNIIQTDVVLVRLIYGFRFEFSKIDLYSLKIKI